MQSLFLALRHVRARLAAEEEDRRVCFVVPGEDGAPEETIDWRQFWFGEPPGSAAG
jgi:hypothetical protein